MTDSKDLKEITLLMQRATMKAGVHSIKCSQARRELTAQKKCDNSLVLELDIENQALILEALGGALPVAAEEDPSSHDCLSENEFFTVDPVDGTTACRRFLSSHSTEVGFGPLLGYFKNGVPTISVYYNVPERTLYTAVRGQGVSVNLSQSEELSEVSGTVPSPPTVALERSAVLFYIGNSGEPHIVQKLRDDDIIETAYRFGGFANDCTRLARGLEQIDVQFAVKPWDYPAVLFPLEAGYDVIVDPLGRGSPLLEWQVQMNNPVIIAQPAHTEPILDIARQAVAEAASRN